jgi:hypothetical protein
VLIERSAMTVTRDEFFADPNVASGLEAYAAAALDHLESRNGIGPLPDPIEFLRSRGIRNFPEGGIEVEHTFGPNARVEHVVCPPGTAGDCGSTCRWVHGQLHCVWVCHCVPNL